ncbi:MAG: hypothetical protein JWP57_1820 [Spirosoma sp.]|nr:hypothetical protein [Spirosoma sp.]
MLLFLYALGTAHLLTQSTDRADTLQTTKAEKIRSSAQQTEVVSLLLYNRTIVDMHGNVRFDQNVVPTFRLNRTLKFRSVFAWANARRTSRPITTTKWNSRPVSSGMLCGCWPVCRPT